MKITKLLSLAFLLLWTINCAASKQEAAPNSRANNAVQVSSENAQSEANSDANPNAVDSSTSSENSVNEKAQTKQPKTVRDFFNLLPQKYFLLEGCSANPTPKNCEKARAEYLKNYLEVEDTANGYMRGGCDGAQSCFQMALFKQPDGTYIVGLTTSFEMGENSYFLEYRNGAWRDIGSQIVPEYGKNKVYELPRYGTNVEVYANELVPGEDFRERGRKLYDLVWKDGKFTKK